MSLDVRGLVGAEPIRSSPAVADALLAGQTLRGVTDAELATLAMPIAVMPSVPDNQPHQRCTVDRLRIVVPHGRELPGCPGPLHRDFPGHLEQFLDAVATFAGDPWRRN